MLVGAEMDFICPLLEATKVDQINMAVRTKLNVPVVLDI
jgi:hypothetical protein